MSLFPEIDNQNPRSRFGVLFRHETHVGGAPSFLIRSNIPPTDPTGSLQTKRENLSIREGVCVAFRVGANNVNRQCEQVCADTWVESKLAGALSGIEVLNVNREVLSNRRWAVQIDMIDGVGVVTDSTKLEELMTIGVGRAKSYGAGLLTVRSIG